MNTVHKLIRIFVKLFWSWGLCLQFKTSIFNINILLYLYISYSWATRENSTTRGVYNEATYEKALPCDWSWTISESKRTEYCKSYTYVNQTCFIKPVQFDSTHTVTFLLNGEKIPPQRMTGCLNSFQEFTSLKWNNQQMSCTFVKVSKSK